MTTRKPNNPLALAVLTVLAEKPMHPYEMSVTLKERRKEDSIKLNFGSLYSVVDSLQKRGLIEARHTQREGNRPERTVYAITHAGRDLMVSWLSDLLSKPVKEYPHFEAALSLMPTLAVDDVVSLLEKRVSQLHAKHETDSQILARAAEVGMPRLFGIEHEYEIALLEAEIRFVESLLDDLRNGNLSGLDMWRRFEELRPRV